MANYFGIGTVVAVTSLILLALCWLILDMKKEIINRNKELERRMQHMASEINITTSATSSIRKNIWDYMLSRKSGVLRETKANIQDIVKVKNREEVRSSLPMEVVENILSRLPSKCVLKFRSVCVQWNTLLSYNHRFMMEHHGKALLFRPMLISGYSSHGIIPLFSMVGESMKDCSINHIASSLSDYNISNHVHGLVCLSHPNESDNYIVNPSTLEVASFPGNKLCMDSSDCTVGLGYDEDEHVYKIVRLTTKGNRIGCLCEVLTVGAENWRILDEISAVVLCNRPCCFFGGKLHWLTVVDKKPLSLGILSFDIKHEKVETYPISIEFDSGTKCSEMALKEFKHHFYLVRGSKKSVWIWELIKFNHCNNKKISFQGDKVYHIDMSVYVPYSASTFRIAYVDVHDDDFLFHDNDCVYHIRGGKLCNINSIPYTMEERWLCFYAESIISPRKLFMRKLSHYILSSDFMLSDSE